MHKIIDLLSLLQLKVIKAITFYKKMKLFSDQQFQNFATKLKIFAKSLGRMNLRLLLTVTKS